ncbi:MFS transporter [Candidatus Bathyarchaeota archaeon]|nr:MAG: MFS transporter [Candidatus Bathyarchaeota archaeon]
MRQACGRVFTDQRIAVKLSTALAFGPTGIIWAFLPIQLRSLGASFSLISLVAFIPAIETIVLSPVWGGILDSTGKGTRILALSFVVQAVGFSLFPFLKDPAQFVFMVALMGLFSSSFIPIFAALATETSTQYGRAIGEFWTAASLGYASATLIGGVLFQFLDPIYLYILGALYGYSGLLVVSFLTKQGLTIVKSVIRPEGYWSLLRQRNVLILCGVSILALVSSSSFNNFFTIYLVDSLSGSRLMAGLAATATTVFGAIAFRIVGPLDDRFGRKPMFLLGAVGYMAYFATIYFVTNTVVVTILWTLPIYPLIQASAAALMSDYTSIADRGKGLGILESAISLGGGLGPLIGGVIADATQLQSVILFAFAAALGSAVLSQFFLREQTQRRRSADSRPANPAPIK